MIVFYERDTDLTIEELEDFIDAYDTFNVFDTKNRYHWSFLKHMRELMRVGQVLTFRDSETGNLKGFCSWAMVHKYNKRDINKLTWELPVNVNDGDILYVSTCMLLKGASMLKVRRFLAEKYRGRLKECLWYRHSKNQQCFSLQFKGDVACPQPTAV